MENSNQEILETLRMAAIDRQWNTSQDATARLLGELNLFQALEIVIEQLNRHLPTFQRYHPDDANPSGKFVRELMISVVAFGFAPDKLPDYLPTDYPTPGSGQFVNAVLEMCRGMQKDRTPLERSELLASAIANAILARLTESWYGNHPDEYQRVRNNQIDPATGLYTDEDAAKIPLMLWADEGVARRDTALWLQVANALERRLPQSE